MPLAQALSSILLALGDGSIPIRISYDAPSSCPTEAAFYDAVQARTDHVRRATGDEAALDVSVRVSRTERGFVGQVRETVNHSESAARTVDGATCKEVVEALSLTLVLSVDPNPHAPGREPTTAALPLRDSAPDAGDTPATVTPALELEVGLSVLATEVLISDLSVGSALSATLRRETGDRQGASLELSLLFATTGALARPVDHKAEFEGVALDACPLRWQVRRIELAPCALAQVGLLEATGRGVSAPLTVERGWWSAGLEFQLAALLGRGFVFEGALGAAAPLVKRRFYLTQPDHVIAETPDISPLMRLGLGFRF